MERIGAKPDGHRIPLIETLAKRPGLVKTRDQLIDAAYGETIYVDDRTIDSHINVYVGNLKALMKILTKLKQFME